jgi:sporulation protein YlmC with PRC-barrel domain
MFRQALFFADKQSISYLSSFESEGFALGSFFQSKVNIQYANFIMGFWMNAEITSLLDQDVYTQKGVFVGRVEDAVLDPENGVVSGLALGDVNRELFDQKGKGIVIPYRWVTAVGDIVIIRHLTRNAKDERKVD